MKLSSLSLQIVGKAIVWSAIILALIPLVFMVTTSLKPTGETQTIPPKWLFVPTLQHYANIFGGETSSSQAFLPLLWHSTVVAVSATVLAIFVGMPAAYALSRLSFRGKAFVAKWILSTIMFPPIVAAIPIFIFAGQLELIDTYPILIIPYAAFNLPLVVWLL
ncbi:MAG: carbohydrate ABC transporter permease, partial [Verrucomicrobia bacterium]|nr:carbohydrate ABC transporter permease [Verrucomicrobiota bacterium]